jgi:hypothetical protein
LYPKPSKLPATLMDEKDVVNTMRAFHCANYAKTCTFAARSNTCGIRVGGMVVAALGDGDGGAFEKVTYKDLGRYLVLEITHRASGAGHYENSLWGVVGYTETLPADHIVLPRAFPEPATVTDNEDPKKQGRVKVKFLWQDPSLFSISALVLQTLCFIQDGFYRTYKDLRFHNHRHLVLVVGYPNDGIFIALENSAFH